MEKIAKSLYETPWALFAVVIIVVAVVYHGVVQAPFYFDDFHSVVDNSSVRHVGNLFKYWLDPKLFTSEPGKGMYRPVLMTSYLLNYLCFGYNPAGWHLTSLFLHLVVVLLLMLLARRLTGEVSSAVFVGLFFGCHPVGVEAVTYISARGGLLAAVFGLAALLAAESWISKKDARLWWAVLAVVFFTISLASKENAASLPAVAVLWGWVLAEGKARRRWWAVAASWVAVLAIYIAFRRWYLSLETLPMERGRPVGSNLLTQASVMARYIRVMFWPWGLSAAYGMGRTSGLFTPPGKGMPPPFVAILLLILIVSAAVAMMKKKPLVSFGILWFLVTVAPESVVPLNLVAADRRFYFPLAGMVIALVSVGGAVVRGRSKFRLAMPVAVVALFAILTLQGIRRWSSEFALWSSSVRWQPSSALAWDWLGSYYLGVGRLRAARLALEMAAEKQSFAVSRIEGDLGVVAVEGGELDEAAGYFRKALRRNPADWRTRVNLAILEEKRGNYHAAEEHLREVLKLEPQHYTPWFNLGNVLRVSGKLAEAENAYREALRRKPNHVGARTNLALTLESSGDLSSARTELMKVLELKPSFAPALFALARIEYKLGNLDASAQYLKRYLRLREDDFEAWRSLASLLKRMGREAEAREAVAKASEAGGNREGRGVKFQGKQKERVGR